MMRDVQQLLANNRAWAEAMWANDPDFFPTLAQQQAPPYLWIGCADSRVPANQIVGVLPGEMFVHRNVANVVVHTDLNCLSVIQYAVEVLQVRHIIVCGHYGCGGVTAALQQRKLGLIDNWLRHIQDIMYAHAPLLAQCAEEEERVNLLCELNVIEQVVHVCQTTVVQNAWEQGQAVAVHGLIYGLHNGLLQELGIAVSSQDELQTKYAGALAALPQRRLAPSTRT